MLRIIERWYKIVEFIKNTFRCIKQKFTILRYRELLRIIKYETDEVKDRPDYYGVRRTVKPYDELTERQKQQNCYYNGWMDGVNAVRSQLKYTLISELGRASFEKIFHECRTCKYYESTRCKKHPEYVGLDLPYSYFCNKWKEK